MTITRGMFLVFLIGSSGACDDNAVQSSAQSVSAAPTPAGKGIGQACRPPAPPVVAVSAPRAGRPTAMAVDRRMLAPDRSKVARGVPYCLPFQAGQDGVMTANCSADADCPSGTACDGSICRRSCTSDTDCGPGLGCRGEGTRFCDLFPLGEVRFGGR
jgi:hypothetical protein